MVKRRNITETKLDFCIHVSCLKLLIKHKGDAKHHVSNSNAEFNPNKGLQQVKC